MATRPRRPVVVSQLLYLLPDGSPDPANTTDCGESCCTSVIATARGVRIGPGCVRQALGKAETNGSTTAHDLGWYLSRFGLSTDRGQNSSRVELEQRIGSGCWSLALGSWIAPGYGHWEVFYDFGPQNLWAMDPYTGRDVEHSADEYDRLSEQSNVYIKDPTPRRY